MVTNYVPLATLTPLRRITHNSTHVCPSRLRSHFQFTDLSLEHPWDWYIYLHLPLKTTIHVGKFTILGCYEFVKKYTASNFHGWSGKILSLSLELLHLVFLFTHISTYVDFPVKHILELSDSKFVP